MGDTRKTKRSVVMTRESAAAVVAGIADGLRKSELLIEGEDGKILLTPGNDVKLRVYGGPDGADKAKLLVKLSWERTRTLRDKPAPTLAAKGAR